MEWTWKWFQTKTKTISRKNFSKSRQIRPFYLKISKQKFFSTIVRGWPSKLEKSKNWKCSLRSLFAPVKWISLFGSILWGLQRFLFVIYIKKSLFPSRNNSLNKIKGFFRRSVLNKVEYICRLGQNSCDLTSGSDRQRCQKCRLTACFKAGMRENFIRKRKNRTKTRRTLENMKRPSVIISPFTCEQVTFSAFLCYFLA